MEHGNREKLNWVGLTERYTVDSIILLPALDRSESGWGWGGIPGLKKKKKISCLIRFQKNLMYYDRLTFATTLSKISTTVRRSLPPPWLALPVCQAQLASFISSHLPLFCFDTSSLV